MFRGFSAETIIICSNIIKEKIMVYLALLTTFVYIIREFSVKKMRGIRGQKKQNQESGIYFVCLGFGPNYRPILRGNFTRTVFFLLLATVIVDEHC